MSERRIPSVTAIVMSAQPSAGRTTGNNKDDRLGLTTAQVTEGGCMGIVIQSRTIKICMRVIISIFIIQSVHGLTYIHMYVCMYVCM